MRILSEYKLNRTAVKPFVRVAETVVDGVVDVMTGSTTVGTVRHRS